MATGTMVRRTAVSARCGALGVLIVGVLSGCLGASAERDSAAANATDSAAAADGRIVQGVVVDQELRPLPGAVVTHIGTGANATTDEAGAFNLSGLPAQPDVLLQARHPPHQAQTLRVNLKFVPRADVRFVLPGGPGPEGHHVTNITRGQIACQVAFGSHHGFPGFYRQSCGDAVPGSRERAQVPVDPGVGVVVVELVWEPQSQAADIMGLTVYVSSPADEILVGSLHNYAGDHYIQLRANKIALKSAQTQGGVIDSFVHVDPSALDEHVPTNAGVVVQQSFTLYTTAFYREAPTPVWSALDGS